MIITDLELKNWRNFKSIKVQLGLRQYILGPNASGKSNLLDVFRFLRDIANPAGGGLSAAIDKRGGLTKVRCLNARKDPEVLIDLRIEDAGSDSVWRYVLGMKSEPRGKRRPLVSKEQVWKNGKNILDRPMPQDDSDPERLTQTHLEQINANAAFRDIAEFFRKIVYLNLVPQLVRHGDQIAGNVLEDDPFGQGFLERVARTPEKTLNKRLSRIEKALTVAVPQLSNLKFTRDDDSGRPHLEARYKHWRPDAGWQRETEFSDGTLRMIALMWILQEGSSTLLLEEPEQSLDESIIRQLPFLLSRAQRGRNKRQVIITTHSEALLSDQSIRVGDVICLRIASEGTDVLEPTSEVELLMKSGLSAADVLLPKAHPSEADQIALQFDN